jgi:hypothetical protein
MSNQDFSKTFLVDQSPEEAFAAIVNVRGWWSETIEGSAAEPGDVFRYRHKAIHDSTQKLEEAVPATKIVWLVTDARLSFTRDPGEWKGTHLRFDIAKKRDQTEIRFTHVGLVEAFECFDACSKGWSFYVGDSLREFITTGKGQPDRKAA